MYSCECKKKTYEEIEKSREEKLQVWIKDLITKQKTEECRNNRGIYKLNIFA